MSAAVSHSVFRTSECIIAGNGSLSMLGKRLAGIGNVRNVLIISSPSIHKQGFVADIRRQLRNEGIGSDELTGIRPEPTADQLEQLHRSIEGEPFDVYIGIGGGSVLDAAKLLSVLRTNRRSIRDMLGIDRVEKPGVPTVLIPTTSGTGSEVTPNAIVTLPDESLKVGAVSSYLLPRIALLDPELTLTLPRDVTAATGVDALTHALESYICNKANPISDMMALESIRKISGSLLAAYDNGTDLKAREEMLYGSMFGGMALTSAGTAAVHALAYPLGGKFHISHGLSNAMLLPHVMRYQIGSITGKLQRVAEAMGLDTAGLSASESAERVIETMELWLKRLNIPRSLRQFGVSDEHLDDLADSASKVTRLLNNNPKTLSVQDMKAIYAKLL
ncbi:iron-containing alcohol dehydrogenase [Paenibacillus alkalitolerans]|uniref:iron-containing alcohol dehydrogenase n=1 Tax=Paenibacillus alkalitolerans TaxID=2799335 RepID=UPI0018F50FE2|nr:iron-containing alcohol dehydrogenase [Paenibacillus alkalitolerans]